MTKTEMVPFRIDPICINGRFGRSKTVKYPAGTSPAEVAVHQFARFGYTGVNVTRGYDTKFSGTYTAFNRYSR